MRPPRLHPTHQLAVIVALGVLLLCSASAALAAPAPDVAPQDATTSTIVLGPLGIFDDPRGNEPYLRPASTEVESVSAGLQDEELAIIRMVREIMSPDDQATLDELLASVTAQETRFEDARLEVESILMEVNSIADEYLRSLSQPTPDLEEPTIPTLVLLRVTDDWIFPVQGPHSFSDTFGAPRSGGRTHKGADIFCKRDTPLVAVVDGVIVGANPVDTGLGGRTVSLRGADGHRYYYAHLSSLGEGIQPGVRVNAGQVVGYAGNTGNARYSAVHLHFEIHPWGGAAIDPYPILVGARTIPEMTTTTTTTATTTATTTETTDTTETTTTTTATPATPATTDTAVTPPDATIPDPAVTTTTTTDGPTSTTLPPTTTTTTTTSEPTTTTTNLGG